MTIASLPLLSVLILLLVSLYSGTLKIQLLPGAAAAAAGFNVDSVCTNDDPASETCQQEKASWTDELGQNMQKFLKDNVFGKKEAKGTQDSASFSMIAEGIEDPRQQWDGENSNPFFQVLDGLGDAFATMKEASSSSNPDDAHSSKLVDSLVSLVASANEKEQTLAGMELFTLLKDTLNRALVQMENAFGDVLKDVDSSILMAMIYYMAYEDARKTPSWKRRQHRFYQQVSKQMVLELHDALYLSQLAYVETEKDFINGLEKFQNNAWAYAGGTTNSLPYFPAHFLLIRKKQRPLKTYDDLISTSIFPWESKAVSELEVALVVRGTKDISDALADVLLEPVEYRGGLAHGGIVENGKNLAMRYVPTLERLLKESGRDKIKLFLVGHSLGAAAAAIAAIELQEYDWITVEAIGFGCPSILSEDLSIASKDYVTTIVSDADMIPRMSGSSVVNVLLDLLSFDWTDEALDDLEHSLERARAVLPLCKMLPSTATVLGFVRDRLEKDIKPRFNETLLVEHQKKRMASTLIPPGECIHFFRNGIGYTGTYTPCSFFSELELSRTLVDDHLVMPGYHRALLTHVRDWEQDFNFDFVHAIVDVL